MVLKQDFLCTFVKKSAMSSFHKLKVSHIIKETPNSVSITFDIPEHLSDNFQFKAGQYITLRHRINDLEIRRAYSICASPKKGVIKVGVKKIEKGTFSVFANEQLREGDILEVMPPEGSFAFMPNANHKNTYGAFVAGSGITPVLSIITTILEDEPNSKVVLVYGNQSQSEAMFHSDLELLKEYYPNRLSIEYIYSRSEEKNALRGRIDRSVVNYLLKNKYGEALFENFYLCGPEAMIKEVSKTLQDRGVSKENILFELFSSTEEGSLSENHQGSTQITVIVDDESESFTMQQDQSVLDAILDKGLDVPYSCQGGICSSCIARIKEGKAEMAKNQILTDTELEEGLILTCQAHPTTTTLIVDYDDV